jgi:tRNA-Thr(GGU) m(6)t(6)A37 methyltransferase TsaA
MYELKIRPVGLVQNDIREPSLVASSGDLKWQDEDCPPSHPDTIVSEIIINSDYAGILDGIEDFSHLLVLYWGHRVDSKDRSLMKVHPMGRKDLPFVGVFSTCSPVRPNPILISAVRLLERKDFVLRVEGLDAVNGSPILDIKPYLPTYYAINDVRLSDWMERILEEIGEQS